MLIKCCDCKAIDDDTNYCFEIDSEISNHYIKDVKECKYGEHKEGIKYRYALADKLYNAVLERLLDPKNVAKGEFFKNIDRLLVLTKDELYELNDAYDGGAAQRIIEECGDVGAYLAAIIDAVGGDNNAKTN